MSVFVEEILEDLKHNPESFRDYCGQGVEKDNVIISGYGNTAILSVIDVHINEIKTPTTYVDKFRLERAIGNWYRNIPLSILKDK